MTMTSVKKDSRPLTEPRVDNRQVSLPAAKPAWRREEPVCSSPLSENAWPAAVPKKAGRPDLGLSLQGKVGFAKPVKSSSPVGPARILADPPTHSTPARHAQEKENSMPGTEGAKTGPSQPASSRRRRAQRRKRQAEEEGSYSGSKMAKLSGQGGDLREHLNAKRSAPVGERAGAEMHQAPQAKMSGGAEMHLPATVTSAEMHSKNSVGKGAAKHPQAKRGGGAEMHLQSTVTGAEMHLKNSVGKSDDPAKQGKLDPYIPVRSQEAKEAAPDSARSTLLNSSHQSGWEDANADAENSITSRTTSQKTDSASNSNQSSYASTPGEKRAETSQASGSNPIQVVSERLQWLIWDWRDQIRKSNCSESIKAKDLEMIKDLVVGSFMLENFGEHLMLVVGQQTCDHLGPIREACGTDAGVATWQFRMLIIGPN